MPWWCVEKREINYLPGRKERERSDDRLRGGGWWCVEKTGEPKRRTVVFERLRETSVLCLCEATSSATEVEKRRVD